MINCFLTTSAILLLLFKLTDLVTMFVTNIGCERQYWQNNTSKMFRTDGLRRSSQGTQIQLIKKLSVTQPFSLQIWLTDIYIYKLSSLTSNIGSSNLSFVRIYAQGALTGIYGIIVLLKWYKSLSLEEENVIKDIRILFRLTNKN